MSMSDEKIVSLRLDRLIPDPDNVNTHSEINIAQIKASIDRFGFLDPIGCVRHPERRGYYIIVEGHGRREAAEELGMGEVPCIVLSLTDAERKGYGIAHNQIASISTMNTGAISGEFQRLGVERDDYLSLGFSEEDALFLPGMRGNGMQATGDAFSAPGGGEYIEHPAGEGQAPITAPADNGIGANSQTWKGFIPVTHRTMLRFANEVSYARFSHMLMLLRERHPLTGTHAERLQCLLADIGFTGETVSADA